MEQATQENIKVGTLVRNIRHPKRGVVKTIKEDIISVDTILGNGFPQLQDWNLKDIEIVSNGIQITKDNVRKGLFVFSKTIEVYKMQIIEIIDEKEVKVIWELSNENDHIYGPMNMKIESLYTVSKYLL